MPIPIELVTNRLLLDSNFDGYKLSLKELITKKREFPVTVDRVLLNTNQYSILHAKIFGLHNHLIGDPFDETDSVYFIDSDWTVCKTYIDSFSDDLTGPIIVWHVPKVKTRANGDFNVSMKFVTKDIAVAGDGTGLLYILNTGNRSDDDTFTVCYSGEVAGIDEPFVIMDAVLKMLSGETQELHLLLISLKQDAEDDRYVTLIHWITLSKIKGKDWTQVALRQIRAKSAVQYLALEKTCESIYVVSDGECKFTVNSETPVVEKTVAQPKKLYTWSQNFEDITVSVPLKINANKNVIKVIAESNRIEVKYDQDVLMKGELFQRIDPDLTTWNVRLKSLEIVLNKNLSGTMWTEFIKGDKSGHYEPDKSVVGQLEHLCNDAEAASQSDNVFNSQQIEECDFGSDTAVKFVRLSGKTNDVTHIVDLGLHGVLLQPSLTVNSPRALGIRHDVDVCIWQPNEDADSFGMVHEGTLLAFGYVQASKSNRKFLACPPDMSYSVICETTRHIFLYRQKTPVLSGELRNRSSGRSVQNIAEQHVISLSNEEFLGIYPTNSTLFVLQENCITAIKV